jgi:CTP:molybdopterin cytidylyltransferase MocA
MGFPKALLPFGSSFFLRRIYDALVAAETVPVHIVINAGLQVSLKRQMKQFPQGNFVLNNEPARGQIHSLQLGLQAARQCGADAAIVALVDQPAIAVSTMTKLREAFFVDPEKLCVACYKGRPGHPILIPRSFFGAFIGVSEGQTARDIIAAHASETKHIETDDAQVVADIDSPEDFARLREMEDELD